MIKKIVCNMIVCVMLLGLVGCASSSTDEDNEMQVGKYFTRIPCDSFGYRGITVYMHNSTKVMYMTFKFMNSGGLTVMLDTDGTPLTYDEFMDER